MELDTLRYYVPTQMSKHALILEAAARLFGDHGYRGATTRRIALEAGVSEVTLFRQFGTKEALLREAIGAPSRRLRVARLPETPQNPERELVVWCAAYLRQLRAARKVIRKSLAEVADRPSVARRVAALPTAATRRLREYLERASQLRVLPSEFDVTAAATVLSGVLFADAIGRDLMPDEFPEPAREVHKVYVRFVLGRMGDGSPPGRLATKSKTAAMGRAAPGERDRRSTRSPGGATPGVFDRRRSGTGRPASLGPTASGRARGRS